MIRALHTALVAAFGLALVLHVTALHGAAWTRDSASYVSAARGLAAGEGLLDYDGSPFLHWPPLYPALLALPARAGVDAPDAARVLNALAVAALVGLAGAWMARARVHPALAAAACLALVVAGPTMTIAVHVWSEPVMLVLALAAAFCIEPAARGSWTALLALCALGALAGLQRYAGLAVGVSAAGALLRADRGRPWKGLYVGLVSLAPGLHWMLTHVPVRPAPSVDTADHMLSGLATTGAWFIPGAAPEPLLALVAVVALSWLLGDLWRHRGELPDAYLPLFLGVYVALMGVAATSVLVNRADDRYLSPLWTPGVLLAALAADRRCGALEAAVPRARTIAAVLAALALVPAAARTGARVREWHDSSVPGTLRDAETAALPIWAEVRKIEPASHVYSNVSWLAYAWTGRRDSAMPRSTLEALLMKRRMESELPTLVVWVGETKDIVLSVLPGDEKRMRHFWRWRFAGGGICQVMLAPNGPRP